MSALTKAMLLMVIGVVLALVGNFAPSPYHTIAMYSGGLLYVSALLILIIVARRSSNKKEDTVDSDNSA